MSSGGHNRLPDEVKKARGTFAGTRSTPQLRPAALSRWPSPPRDFTPAEKASWKKLGKSLMPLNTVSEADLLMAGYAAKMMARLDAMLADATTKPAALTAQLSSVSRQLREFGLTPASRTGIAPLAQEVEDEDPVSEFA